MSFFRRIGPYLPALTVIVVLTTCIIVFRHELDDWFAGRTSVAPAASDSHGASPGDGRAVAYWTCPMHPSVRLPEAVPCPICHMDLTPVTHAELSSGTVRIDAQRRQLIGVTTAPVTRRELAPVVVAQGVVRAPEAALADVTARVSGRITRMLVKSVGERVSAGQLLAELESPDLYAAQAEYLAAAAQGPEVGLTNLARAARSRLLLFGMDEGAIRALAQSGKATGRLALRAPHDGVVMRRDVVAGSPVGPDAAAFRIGGLDPIWIEASLYELDTAFAEVGLAARVTMPYLPGFEALGTIAFVQPVLDPDTRTLTVRIELPNADGRLRPDMYAEVRLLRRLPARLTVPIEAVVYTGPRRLVFLDLGDGRMKPVEVTIGARDGEHVEVLTGLEEGNVVVTSGNFLIGAESRLRSALGMWGTP